VVGAKENVAYGSTKDICGELSRNGSVTPKGPDISPDGKQIVFDRVQENADVVLIDLPPSADEEA
jgi:Mrp family chromosome partitioning ATPase